MAIEDVKRKLAEYNAHVTEFVEKYRQEDDHVYYEVGDTTYVIRSSQFGIHYDGPTVSEENILEFEQRHNIRLPEDYRAFLLEISDGKGAEGPWLYLYSFQEVQARLKEELSKPFPYTDRWIMRTDPVDDPYSERPVHGTINIGTGGSTIEYILVVTGDERGYVWIDDRGGDYGIWPLVFDGDWVSEDYGYGYMNATSSRVDFLGWYENWLDAHLVGSSRWKGKYGREEGT